MGRGGLLSAQGLTSPASVTIFERDMVAMAATTM
jgi:hypothetical protein